MEKVRKAFDVEEELLGQVDALLPQADVRSRNEFVNQALRFYIGYLTSEKIENYMSFIPFFILKTVYEESFYLKSSARVLVVPLLSFRAYARNPPVSEPEMELVISNE